MDYLAQALEESIATKRQFWNEQSEKFLEAARALEETLRSGHKILIFGNGGSACDALHFSGELVNRYRLDRPGLACIALTADAPLLTCIANDSAFEQIFSRQVEALGRPGDLAIGISTSGKSKNVVAGLVAARKQGLKTLALIGDRKGAIGAERLADVTLLVEGSSQTARIQETHEWILHALCEYLDRSDCWK